MCQLQMNDGVISPLVCFPPHTCSINHTKKGPSQKHGAAGSSAVHWTPEESKPAQPSREERE